jgi:hypothetical protein
MSGECGRNKIENEREAEQKDWARKRDKDGRGKCKNMPQEDTAD